MHAAQDILEYGLPRLEEQEHHDVVTEHVNALGRLMEDLAECLKRFASRMHAYRHTEAYHNTYEIDCGIAQRVTFLHCDWLSDCLFCFDGKKLSFCS